MASHAPVQPSKKEIDQAQKFWDSFIVWSKRGVISVSVILAAMALLFT